MNQQDVSQTLKAGGLVPHNAKLGKDEAVDRVVACAYRHPVLPGRVVVRLTAESVAAGDELEMATLGFAPGEQRGPVGKERKRPLGFPGWALVNDPKNARYALDVVKEFKKHARKAKSKPGHARDGIEGIAAKLGKTVPQFLPSFYEEAGRAFIEHGAPSFAAAMFGKARAAEAVHALEVDEQHRVDGFLEFALAGAVTTKALTDYAKELAEHHAPAVAYGHFRQLCLQRTLGGMPPWAGMAKDLRRLARAAKLDPDEEDAKLVAEIIESPALAKAAGEFWRAYEAPIAALGRRSAAVRGALLHLFPTGSSYSAELDEAWLDLIEASGATAGLVGDAPEEARPSGGRAAWFNKLMLHLSRSWKETQVSGRAFELLRRMAPALVEEGAPIACVGRWDRFDLDLAELALELGVPVVPPENPRIDLKAWGQGASVADRGRDPVRAAAHPAIGPLVAAAVAREMGNEPFDSMSRGKAGFLAAKRRWLEALLQSAEDGALPMLDEVLAQVAGQVRPETFAELAELHPRFAALDAARALARTLQIGLLDEFGWPALEEAAHELNPDGKAELALYGGLPAVVLANKTRAVAVGPTGRLGVHDLVIPPRHELVSIRYIGGQFLVAIKASWQLYGYWSAAPKDRFQSDASIWHVPEVAVRAAVLADGAWQEGARAIRAGDRVVPQAGLMSHDGTTAWVADHRELRHKLREASASGEPGRVSWPAWLEAGLAPEWYVDAMRSYVLPAPEGLARSPLGISDGRLGARVAYQGANQHHKTACRLTTIDGRTWTGPARIEIAELVELPSGESRPLQEETAWGVGMTTSLWNPEGTVRGASFGPKDARFWRGSVAPYPDCLWHALTPRDVAGSRRLRAITDGDARKLVDAVAALGVTTELADLVPVDIVARHLPEVTHERLRRGVAGMVALAAQLDRRRADLAERRAPGQASARGPAVTGPDDEAIQAALGGWIDPMYDSGSAVLQIAFCGELFRSTDRSDRVVPEAPGSRIGWFSLAVAPGALAFFASAIGTPAEHRRTIAALLSVMARELPDPAKLRVASGVRTDDSDPIEGGHAHLKLSWHGGNAYAIRRQNWNRDVLILEYAPEGKFQPPPHIALGAWRRGVAPVPDEVVAAARASAGLPPEVQASSSAATPSTTGGLGGVIGTFRRFFGRGRSSAAEAGAATTSPGTSTTPGSNLEATPLAARAEMWPAEADALAAEAGLTPSEAVYLVAGCPGAGTRTSNFLDKELREQLGLKAAQAAVARDALAAIPRGKRLAALDEAARGGDLAQAWIRHVGKRVAVPEELVADADRELLAPIAPSQALPMFARATEVPQLTKDARWAITPDGSVFQVGMLEPTAVVPSSGAGSSAHATGAIQLVASPRASGAGPGTDDSDAFALPVLRTACQYLPFLYAELPVGHPLRAQAAVAHQLVLARLENPSLLFELENVHISDEQRPGVDSLLEALGGEPITGLAEACTGRIIPGALIVRQSLTAGSPPREHLRLKLRLRPATYDAKAAPTVDKLSALGSGWGLDALRLVRIVRSADIAAMMARIAETPVREGGWEQDPASSAPRIVDKAARKLGVSKDAAALYLQYLVLLWPTPKNLAMWNGWDARRLAAANAELGQRELILEAKRERAQRPWFLPGGWEALKSPHPAMESWKLPFYGARTVEGAAAPTLPRFVALAPFHLMFERAWQRIEDGDVPKYEQVKR